MTKADAERTVRVLLARHPETEANSQRRFVGRGDSPYTSAGAVQAAALGDCLRSWGPDAVLASPQRRALQAASLSGSVVTALDDLREIDFGAAEGLTYRETERAGIEMDHLGGPGTGEIAPGGETWDDFAARVARASAVVAHAGGRVAVVTHGGVVRALLTFWLGLPHQAAWGFAVPPASVATLTLHGPTGTLETFGLRPVLCPWQTDQA